MVQVYSSDLRFRVSGTLPLEGLCIVKSGHSLAAPYAGMNLGSLGAEMIKVESEGGGD